MNQSLPKRFYKDVSVVREGKKYLVRLDGRTLKTPGKMTLAVDGEHVAQLIADEWAAQEESIIPATMPVTRLVNVSLELTPDKRPDLVKEARSYAGTDLLCYREVENTPLARRQAEHWDPVLEWAHERGVHLRPTHSLIPVSQNESAPHLVAEFTQGLDDLHLTLFLHLTSVFGSVVLALAVMEGHLAGSQAFDLSRLDEDWQINQWGEDDIAKDIRDRLATEVDALCQILGDQHG